MGTVSGNMCLRLEEKKNKKINVTVTVTIILENQVKKPDDPRRSGRCV